MPDVEPSSADPLGIKGPHILVAGCVVPIARPPPENIAARR
jgi:hypothetical protein